MGTGPPMPKCVLLTLGGHVCHVSIKEIKKSFLSIIKRLKIPPQQTHRSADHQAPTKSGRSKLLGKTPPHPA